jgi:hypothetical protein
MPVNVSPFLKDIVWKLLDKNQDNRPDAIKILSTGEIFLEVLRIQNKLI